MKKLSEIILEEQTKHYLNTDLERIDEGFFSWLGNMFKKLYNYLTNNDSNYKVKIQKTEADECIEVSKPQLFRSADFKQLKSTFKSGKVKNAFPITYEFTNNDKYLKNKTFDDKSCWLYTLVYKDEKSVSEELSNTCAGYAVIKCDSASTNKEAQVLFIEVCQLFQLEDSVYKVIMSDIKKISVYLDRIKMLYIDADGLSNDVRSEYKKFGFKYNFNNNRFELPTGQI